MKTKMNASRFFLLTFCLLMMSSLKVASATKYGFWVGGVEVTSDNYTNITSSAITSGTVKYVPSTNTLTLTNCTISIKGSYKRAIYNKECEGLIIKFVGTNNLSAQDASAVRIETKDCTLQIASGTTTISSKNYEGIYLQNVYGEHEGIRTDEGLIIKGPGKLIVTSTNDCAIEGNIDGFPRSHIVFSDGITATISGPKGDLVDLDLVNMFSDTNCEVTLIATNNSSYPNVKNTRIGSINLDSEGLSCCFNNFVDEPVDYLEGGFPVILQPLRARHRDGSDYTKWGVTYNDTPVYNQDIVFSNRWAVLLIPEFFPDTNFLSYLKTTKFPNKNYLTESEVAGCTTLSMNSKSISSLKGIRFFPALEKLYCSSNNLTELDLSDNTELTELYCSNNKLTALTGIGSKITKISCSNNKFETLSLYSKPSLTSLICSNNSSLKTLNCYYDKLSTLDCTNCGSLTTLNCYSNKLTELNLTGCSKLTTIDCRANQFEDLRINGFQNLKSLDCRSNSKLGYLDCSGNALTSLSVSSCSNLYQIVCDNNQFTSLTITGLPSLISLSCCNNSKLLTLNCDNNALTDDYLQVLGCTALSTLSCYNNQLKSIDLSDCTNLSYLFCYDNQLANLDVSSNTKLRYLDCHNNQISNDILNLNQHKSLTYLDCSKNKIGNLFAGYGSPLETIKCEENQISTLFLSDLNFLKSITCYCNQLTGTKIDDLVGYLPNRMSWSESGELKIIYPAISSEHNVITQAQVQAAWNKNWKTYQLVNGSWTLYEGSSNGIVTGLEPAVSSAAEDATPLYNLSGQRVDKNYKGVVIRNNKKVRMK